MRAALRTSAVLVAACFFASPAWAILDVSDFPLLPVQGAQHITSLSSATALTVPAGARGVWLTVDLNATYTAPVNCTDDGTTPTATVGHTLPPGTSLFLKLSDLTVIKCIQQAATAAIYVSYYR